MQRGICAITHLLKPTERIYVYIVHPDVHSTLGDDASVAQSLITKVLLCTDIVIMEKLLACGG